jgi:hypothetical protein
VQILEGFGRKFDLLTKGDLGPHRQSCLVSCNARKSAVMSLQLASQLAFALYTADSFVQYHKMLFLEKTFCLQNDVFLFKNTVFLKRSRKFLNFSRTPAI